MIFLIPAILLSVCVGVIFKEGTTRAWPVVPMLVINYATATMLAAIQGGGMPDVSAPSLGLAVIIGVLFIAGYGAFSRATSVAGLARSGGVFRISVVIPIVFSVTVWDEVITSLQAGGLSLAFLAFVLMAWPVKRAHEATIHNQSWPWLVLLFIIGGLADTTVKTFLLAFRDTWTTAELLLVVYGLSGLIGVVWWRTTRKGSGDPPPHHVGNPWIWAGVLLGLANYGSTWFFLEAVARLPASIVFPVNHVGVMTGMALVGMLQFGERPHRLQVAGLLLAAVSLVLLTT